jgi:hypothetical protein
MRSDMKGGQFYQLESLTRVSKAFAKLRMSAICEVPDAVYGIAFVEETRAAKSLPTLLKFELRPNGLELWIPMIVSLILFILVCYVWQIRRTSFYSIKTVDWAWKFSGVKFVQCAVSMDSPLKSKLGCKTCWSSSK